MYINDYKLKDFDNYLSQYYPQEGFALSSCESAGEGNMNYTFRLAYQSDSSIIIKQAPPFCAKFPDIEAPRERILFESEFYLHVEHISKDNIRFPRVRNLDRDNYIMLMDDLGEGSDLSSLYQKDVLAHKELAMFASTLAEIHSIQPTHPISNTKMRVLNHAHIFDIPLQHGNGLNLDDITEGLDEVASQLKNDNVYCQRVRELGEVYLSDGKSLLHGDYYPGSWLRCATGLAIIDPEFCFTGAVEFDVGVLLAHLYLSSQDEALVTTLFEHYQPKIAFDKALAYEFAGCEIMRRLIGYAQLPVDLNLTEKARLLELSRQWILKPS